jgi:hypothetical protein
MIYKGLQKVLTFFFFFKEIQKHSLGSLGTACRNIKMASHCFRASYDPITTDSYGYGKIQYGYSTNTKSPLRGFCYIPGGFVVGACVVGPGGGVGG